MVAYNLLNPEVTSFRARTNMQYFAVELIPSHMLFICVCIFVRTFLFLCVYFITSIHWCLLLLHVCGKRNVRDFERLNKFFGILERFCFKNNGLLTLLRSRVYLGTSSGQKAMMLLTEIFAVLVLFWRMQIACHVTVSSVIDKLYVFTSRRFIGIWGCVYRILSLADFFFWCGATQIMHHPYLHLISIPHLTCCRHSRILLLCHVILSYV